MYCPKETPHYCDVGTNFRTKMIVTPQDIDHDKQQYWVGKYSRNTSELTPEDRIKYNMDTNARLLTITNQINQKAANQCVTDKSFCDDYYIMDIKKRYDRFGLINYRTDHKGIQWANIIDNGKNLWNDAAQHFKITPKKRSAKKNAKKKSKKSVKKSSNRRKKSPNRSSPVF